MKTTPSHLKHLEKNRTSVRNVNIEHKEHLSRLEKVATWITKRVGTMGFFLIISGWTILWLSWNVLAPDSLRFDPYPAFVFWLFISNLIQIMLMPLIMLGQNLQGRHSEVRAEADYEVNIKAERELEAIIAHLENQNKLIVEILNNLKKNSKNSKKAR